MIKKLSVILLMAMVILGYQTLGYAANVKLAWDPPDTSPQ